MKIKNCKQEIIKFAVWLTGDREQFVKEQLIRYNNFEENNKTKGESMKDAETSEPVETQKQNFYVYVTESVKATKNTSSYDREVIHEIGISYGLPVELIYDAIRQELENIYKVNREIREVKLKKILFALDGFEVLINCNNIMRTLTKEQFKKEIGYDLNDIKEQHIIDAIFNWVNI